MLNEIIAGIVGFSLGKIFSPLLDDLGFWIKSKVWPEKTQIELDEDVKTLNIISTILLNTWKDLKSKGVVEFEIIDNLVRIHDEAQGLESKKYARIKTGLSRGSNILKQELYKRKFKDEEQTQYWLENNLIFMLVEVGKALKYKDDVRPK